MAAILMPLSDRQGHTPIASLFRRAFRTVCNSWHNFNWQRVARSLGNSSASRLLYGTTIITDWLTNSLFRRSSTGACSSACSCSSVSVLSLLISINSTMQCPTHSRCVRHTHTHTHIMLAGRPRRNGLDKYRYYHSQHEPLAQHARCSLRCHATGSLQQYFDISNEWNDTKVYRPSLCYINKKLSCDRESVTSHGFTTHAKRRAIDYKS